MANRALVHTELAVLPLCLGGNVFGWTVDEQRSFAVLDAYEEGGGNFIDTADTYSTWLPGHVGGESESILGRWMSSRKNRGRVILATKVGSRMGTAPDAYGLSRRYILEEVEASLRRLQTDYIDLYLAHRDDMQTQLEEALAAFDALVRQGKVRYIGASNYSAARLREALQISSEHGYARYECLQPPYHLMNRGAYEGELQALCLQEELGVMTYASLANGFLSGNYRQGQALPSSPRARGIQERYMHEQGVRVLEMLDGLAVAQASTVPQVALAWILAQPGITTAIASATSVDPVRELLAAVEVSLREDEIQVLDRASSGQ